MKRTYDLFYGSGYEPSLKLCEMYADNDSEIIKKVLEMVISIKSEFSEIKHEFIAKQGDRQVLHLTV